MKYRHSSTMLTSEDQRRIISMITELKSAIESILEMRSIIQDAYMPQLKHERLFEEECSNVKRSRESSSDEP